QSLSFGTSSTGGPRQVHHLLWIRSDRAVHGSSHQDDHPRGKDAQCIYRYTPLIVYIMNLFYENIPTFLLIFLSNNARRSLTRLITFSLTTVQTIDLPTTASINE
ncbi:hypothetical protein PMAYCL1PPCAC_30131, partial [Pristionchus mayeri]